MPKVLNPKQQLFLRLNDLEVLYGGAGGGGKSISLLAGALQYVDCPGYNALILRRSFSDLDLPGALMDVARVLLADTDAKPIDGGKRYRFPSGAQLVFGYLETSKDKYRYLGGGWQYMAWDEVTQFLESDYRFLFGWLRRLKNARHIPLRVRAASNPIGPGKAWVKRRFITEGRKNGRRFIPAKALDNPFLDYDSYVTSLDQLEPVLRKQILDGDWDARLPGGMFKHEWFGRFIDPIEWFRTKRDWPAGSYRTVRYWDLAATPPNEGVEFFSVETSKKQKDPDYTVGTKMTERDGEFWVEDVRRDRTTPGGVEDLVTATAERDGVDCEVHMEEEPGSSGKAVCEHYAKLLKKFSFTPHRNTGPKLGRIGRFASKAESHLVHLVEGEWFNDWIDELEGLPGSLHDDQADSAAGGYAALVDDGVNVGDTFVGGETRASAGYQWPGTR